MHKNISARSISCKQPFHFVKQHQSSYKQCITTSARIISCKQSQQDSYKQFTNSKQTINRIIYKNLLRYGMRCKQTIKLLLQMVNTAKIIFKQQFSMLIFTLRMLQLSNNLFAILLTTLIMFVEDTYHC